MAFEAKLKKNPPADLTWPHLVRSSQVHGNAVVVVNGSHRGRGASQSRNAIQETDALVTGQTGLPIAVLTADCLPVFLADPHRRAVAIVHAGWRGLHQKIITKAVGVLAKEFSVFPEELCAALGPAIRSCCYEVGEEFKGHFKNNISTRSSRFSGGLHTPRPISRSFQSADKGWPLGHSAQNYSGGLHFDMPAAAVDEMRSCGISESRIFDSGLCTSCLNDEFFSFRRESQGAGRSMSVIEIISK